MMENALCSSQVEDTWGPTVDAICADGFDFTLLFEEGILQLLPAGVAILWSALRLFQLRNRSSKIHLSWLFIAKAALYVAAIGLQCAILALWASQDIPRTRLTNASNAITLVSYLVFLATSYFEHTRSARPSTALGFYYLISIITDLPRVRTSFFLPGAHTVASLVLASLLVKVLLCIAEVYEKRAFLRDEAKGVSVEETAGVWNRALFVWLNRVFFKGFKSVLTVDTLTPIDDELLAAAKTDDIVRRWEASPKSNDYSLFWVFLCHYKWSLLVAVIPRLVYSGFLFSQPFLVETTLDFIADPEHLTQSSHAYGLIASYAIVYIGIGVTYSIYQHKTYRLLTMYRGSLVSLIYDKTVVINSASITDAEALTLMSADIDRIGASLPLIHEVYASLVDIALSLSLLYRLLGIAMVAPILWIIVCLVIGVPLATAAGNAQTPWLEAIEERLAVTAKVLGSMKAIKMSGLAETVSEKIAALRQGEIRASLRYRILEIFVTISYYASSALAPVWAFGVYILLARRDGTYTLSEGVAFASLSLFELLNQPLIYIVDGVEHMQTVVNSFRRIQEYLMSEEREDPRIVQGEATPASSNSSLSEKEKDEQTVSFDLKTEGNVARLTSLSARYPEKKDDDEGEDEEQAVSDESPASDADEEEEGDRFVLRDITTAIPQRKITMIYGPVGSGKSTLLKVLLGEMQDIEGTVATTFRSAAYCPQSPWICWGTVRSNILGICPMDKPWYDRVVQACGLKTDFQQLPEGDESNTGTRGSRLSGGQQMRVSFARALYCREPVLVLDDVLTGLDRTTEQGILDAVFASGGLLNETNTTVVMATNSAKHLQYADHVILLNSEGSIEQQGSLSEIDLAAADLEDLPSQSSVTTRAKLEIDEEVLLEIGWNPEEEPEPVTRHAGDLAVYGYYAKIAGYGKIALYLFACATFVFGVVFPSVWLQKWTDYNADHPNQEIGYWLGVYGALAAITLIGCSLADSVFRMIVVPKTGTAFHGLLLETTMKATTSFLTSTDAGNTLNRFSQDLQLIDNDLPKSIDQTFFQFFSAIASAILVFIGSGWVAISIPACIVLLALIQAYYLRTSRQLRLLDIEAKAPVFSQFLETLGGVACIRAFGWTDSYKAKNVEVLNVSQKPYYLLWCIQRWLTLVLDLFVAGVAILLVALATTVNNGSTGYLGVALFQVVTFSTTLQTLVTEWTLTETAIGAVSRIRTFVATTKREDTSNESGDVDDTWPAQGVVEWKDVVASYESSTEPVLKGISLSVQAGEKVAICGRTGSGKSTLVSALLRMLDIQSGSISVAGTDVTTIPGQRVRDRLNTLPQEPFFLHGSVRENMDPAETASDEEIEKALAAVGLLEVMQQRGGLDEDMADETLSHGQRQLFCLARAMLQKSNILILDEAGSSVDAATDELMQKVLREQFAQHTIVSIAHKLDTILDFDRVVVLDHGRVAEVGKPRELLQKSGSAFGALYRSQQEE